MPRPPSVRTTLAPNAASTFRRSSDIVSGIVSVTGYPRAAATNARAIPVFPLVGSINSFPGCSMPRFSASQIMEDPIRHFTEYAGLRPSTLPRIVTDAPSVTRLSLTRGVRPMLYELSSKYISDLPIRYETTVFICPFADQHREVGGVQNAVNRQVDALPEVGKWRIVLFAEARSFFLPAFHKSQHFAHRDRLGALRKQVTALCSPAGLDEPTLLQT